MAIEVLDKIAELIIGTKSEFRLLSVFILVPLGIDVVAFLFNVEAIWKYKGKFSCRAKMAFCSLFLLLKILLINWYLRGVDKQQLIDGKSLIAMLLMIVTGFVLSLVPLWIVKNNKFL